MLFAQHYRSVQKHMIERSLFMFDASVPKPNLGTITWNDFVKLCAEKSVTSAKDFATNGSIPLNPSAGVSDDGTRRWLHTREVGHTYYSLRGTVTGTLAPLNQPAIPSNRYMERQFALNLSDSLGMNMNLSIATNYPSRAVFNLDKTKAVLSAVNLNDWYGNTNYSVVMGTYQYPPTLASASTASSPGYAWNNNGNIAVNANAVSAGNIAYAVTTKTYMFNNSGGEYFTRYVAVHNLYQAITGGSPGVIVPVWGMAAVIDANQTLHIALLSESDFSQVNPVLNGNGTARLSELIAATATYDM
ncbi:hypothetical protein D5P86_00985 [Salmonella enterica subsp. enterica serovar Infantis]|nr:hypothetical protein [Salmonella enterica subsp. enterica serovar Infantis]